jgi:hypothetical protein
MKSVDPVLLILSLALLLTVVLFALDVFPYPFGILILSAFAIGRVLSQKGLKRSGQSRD